MSSLLWLSQLVKPPPPPPPIGPITHGPPSFFLLFYGGGFFPELADCIILTGWAIVLLLLIVLAFSLLRTSQRRSARWQYFALLLLVGFGLWSLEVVYNSYQQWSYFYADGPSSANMTYFFYVRTPYLAAIQICQNQFALLASILIVLLVIAGWQLLRACSKGTAYMQITDDRHVPLWTSCVLFVIGLCCLAFGGFLIGQLHLQLIYLPQDDYPFNVPMTVELIGLFTVSLGGPLTLLLLSATSIVRQYIVPRLAFSR